MTSSFDVSDYDKGSSPVVVLLFVISHFFFFQILCQKVSDHESHTMVYIRERYGRSFQHNASTSSKLQDLNDTKNNKTYPYSLGKLFIYFLFIPKRFLLLASTITICNIALLSSTETGRKFSICHTVKPVMERGGYYFTYINYIE